MKKGFITRTERLAREKSERSKTARRWLPTITNTIVRISFTIYEHIHDGLF